MKDHAAENQLPWMLEVPQATTATASETGMEQASRKDQAFEEEGVAEEGHISRHDANQSHALRAFGG
ncbi:unnamed protein product [Bubo scandiacus]